MKKVLRHVAFISASLLSCSAAPQTSAPALAIYPYWNIEQVPLGPASRAGRMPSPSGSAVLLAPGYLIASAEPMGDVADDPSMDPTVFLFDGKTWITGHYVDRDHGTKLALIRADIGGAPATLAGPGKKGRTALRLVGIPWATANEKAFSTASSELHACDGVPDWMYELSGRRARLPAYCFSGRVATLAGGALMDADGKLAGLQVNQTGTSTHAGASSDDIRSFVETYFSSWGSGVKNKPKL